MVVVINFDAYTFFGFLRIQDYVLSICTVLPEVKKPNLAINRLLHQQVKILR